MFAPLVPNWGREVTRFGMLPETNKKTSVVTVGEE